MSIYVFFMPGCRVARVEQQAGDYAYKGKTLVITSDGEAYSRLDQEAIFRFSPNKVSYQYMVDDQILQKDFEVSLSKVSYDRCRYYYSKEINNLFILDERRGTLQVYGSGHEGKGRLSFSGHTFLDLTRVEDVEPLLARRD